MKKELLTVKELAAELRMSLKSIQRAYRKGRSRAVCLFALSLLHLGTSDHIWLHLTNSLHPSRTVWSAVDRRKKGQE